jgi:cation diffusion facilitator CzcD-associated flavoprotein CzcO
MPPPSPNPPPPPPSDIPYTHFACIGTGASGICLGATLARWHGITSIRLFSRDPDLGGTWLVNAYPGAACDVPSALYSFSFAPNPNWSRVLPPQAELLRYLRGVAGGYGLREKMVFGVEVERAEWIEERARWRLRVREVAGGEVKWYECGVLVSGAGHFTKVRELDVPGVEGFQGEVWHSARWRGDVDLEGKRVVVFGNGCTAAQIVPSIVGRVRHLTQVVRSKHWVYPPVDRKVPEWARALLGSVPGLTWLNRAVVYLMAEVDFTGFGMSWSAARFRQMRKRQVEQYMREMAPEKYHDILIPDFEVGCKRRIFDSGYLESLHAEDFNLTDDKAVEILPNGVRMQSGEVIEADVIILANGFTTNEYLGGVEVVGRGGETIKQHWESFGGPEAYNCTALSGFPNFFLVMGMLISGHLFADSQLT